MAINSNYRNDYVGNGATSSYAFTFTIFNATDLRVIVADTSGNATVLSYPSDFSVSADRGLPAEALP